MKKQEPSGDDTVISSLLAKTQIYIISFEQK